MRPQEGLAPSASNTCAAHEAAVDAQYAPCSEPQGNSENVHCGEPLCSAPQPVNLANMACNRILLGWPNCCCLYKGQNSTGYSASVSETIPNSLQCGYFHMLPIAEKHPQRAQGSNICFALCTMPLGITETSIKHADAVCIIGNHMGTRVQPAG